MCAAMRYLIELENRYPEIANEYFNIKFEDFIKGE